MPTEWQSLYDRIAQNKQSVTYGELVALLEAAGFRHLRSKGSHRTFGKEGCFHIVSLKEQRGHVKIGQVTAALRAVRECGND